MEKLHRKDLIDRFRKYEISPEQISAQADKIVMIVRPSMDLDFIHNSEGGTFIFSMWEGYKEEQKTADFISGLVSRGIDFKSIHTSGHADTEALRKMAGALHAKEIVPIHTFDAEKYKECFPDAAIRLVHDGELIGMEEAKETQTNTGPEELKLLEQIILIGELHEQAKGLPDTVFDKADKQMSLRAASRAVSGTWGNFLIGGSFERKFIIPSGLIPNF